MFHRKRLFIEAAAALAAILLAAAVPSAHALQAPGPGPLPGGTGAPALSPEQLRMLRELPEQQRQELLRSLGVEDPGGEQAELVFPETVRRQEPAFPRPEDRVPRLEAHSTIIVRLELPETDGQPPAATSAVARELEARIRRNPQLAAVRGAATYELDRGGVLHFPGIASIRLAGLTEGEAARRIEAEPSLRPYEARVTLLPLTPHGADALEHFGYELFQGAPVTFAPATDVPVPPDYMIGPGDQVRVQLFGRQNVTHRLVVNRDGSLNFPQVGPIMVTGMGFQEMRELLQQRVEEQLIGVAASVTMGELRSIRIFVLGDVTRPGSFTVSGLASMTNALFASGGVTPVGSLRDVQLKRNGETVQRLDLYDLLLRGDSRGDARLMPDDVLFVPPRGPVVAVAGEVQRPAIYELSRERTLAEVIHLAGGLAPTAYEGAVRLERVDPGGGRSVRTVDLGAAGRETVVQSGDIVSVDPILDLLTEHVTLAGHVHRPGAYEWKPGMRLSDLVGSVNELKADADRHYLLVQRQPDLSGLVRVFSVDLAAALANRGGEADPPLHNLDRVTVFDLGSGRVAVMDPLLEKLRLQAVFGRPAQEVTVGGAVRAAGTYPLEDRMRVSDLIRAGASLSDSAFGLTAELTRYDVSGGIQRVVALEQIDLAAVLAGEQDADLVLQPFDFLNIKQVSEWHRRGTVELRGEVRFPGDYPIERGERLSSVIERAGGLTRHAFVEGSVFLRDDLRTREREQIDRLVNRLEADLASLAIQASRAASQGAGAEQSFTVGQTLLAQLRDAEPVGRLVIDLPAALSGNDVHDVVLRDGDQLIVPERTQEVMVLGEVQYPTSHVFVPGLSREDYLNSSGGLTADADARRIYVVRADGAVLAGDARRRWFRQSAGREIRPGDTIVAPMDVDRMPALAMWQSATSILFNLAVAVAAIGGI
jgi:polysaccharide biosynthesis/export protein